MCEIAIRAGTISCTLLLRLFPLFQWFVSAGWWHPAWETRTSNLQRVFFGRTMMTSLTWNRLVKQKCSISMLFHALHHCLITYGRGNCHLQNLLNPTVIYRNASLSIRWYQIILLGDRGTCVLTTCPGLHSIVERPGFELATCWLQVQRPNHLATEPHE